MLGKGATTLQGRLDCPVIYFEQHETSCCTKEQTLTRLPNDYPGNQGVEHTRMQRTSWQQDRPGERHNITTIDKDRPRGRATVDMNATNKQTALVERSKAAQWILNITSPEAAQHDCPEGQPLP